MADSDNSDELERVLRGHFSRHERISPLAIDHAKALFGLRQLDDELIELSELASVRGTEAENEATTSLRFDFGQATVLVIAVSDVTEVYRSDPEVNVTLQSAVGPKRLEFDPGGTAAIRHQGPVRIRVELQDGATGVTDPFTLPLT